MSVGGGYKKGKAEFAVKDVNGKPITIATDSFKNVKDDLGTYKVIDTDGIDIGDNTYGIYFRSPSQDSEASIHIGEGSLVIDGVSTNTSTVQIVGDLQVDGQLHANNIYDTYVHCWLIRGSNYTFYIYTDSTGDNFYNDISSILGSSGEFLISFKGSFSASNSNYYPIQYLHYSFVGSESKYNITFKCLVIRTDGTVTTENMDISVNASSQAQGSVHKIF